MPGFFDDLALPFGVSPRGYAAPTLVYLGTKLFTTFQEYRSTLWTTPNGAAYVFARAWGSAGGPDTIANGISGGNSGAGGYAGGLIPVFGQESLGIAVGDYHISGNGNGMYTGGNQGNACGGGFSGVFRGGTPLLIAGGGGGGQVNGTIAGGAGGGLVGQSTTGGNPGGGQAAGSGGGYLTSAGVGSGGGYYGGGAGTNVGAGGSSFIGSPGLLFGETIGGDRMVPGGNDAAHEYPGGGIAQGDVGSDDNRVSTAGIGYLILHVYGLAVPTAPPSVTIPTTRRLLA